MLNILYCLDENYNYQAYTSIISLLDNISEKIIIFVIHKDPQTFVNLPEQISKHKNLYSLKTIKFDSENKYFPNIEDAHVSEATYYRLYIEALLPKDIKNVLYLDCDVVCLNNPINHIKKTIKKMEVSSSTIAVKTEFIKNEKHEVFFDQIGNNLYKYFNAGVMFINLEKWRECNIISKSKAIISDTSNELLYWDQDVLNIIFQNNYLEIDEILNQKVISSSDNKSILVINGDEIFLHYMGSKKPWTLEGIAHVNSKYYQDNFMKIFLDRYHIVNNWRLYSIYLFLKNTLNFKLIRNTNYFKLIKSFSKTLNR